MDVLVRLNRQEPASIFHPARRAIVAAVWRNPCNVISGTSTLAMKVENIFVIALGRTGPIYPNNPTFGALPTL